MSKIQLNLVIKIRNILGVPTAVCSDGTVWEKSKNDWECVIDPLNKYK